MPYKDIPEAIRTAHRAKLVKKVHPSGGQSLKSSLKGAHSAIVESDNKAIDFYFASFSSQESFTKSIAYIDTGCSSVMSPCEELFTDLVSFVVDVHIADKSVVKSHSRGIFHLSTTDQKGKNTTLIFKDALLIPEFSSTLISDKCIIAQGYSIVLSATSQELVSPTTKILLSRSSNGILCFPAPHNSAQAAVKVLDDFTTVGPNGKIKKNILQTSAKYITLSELQLYHSKFGHISVDTVIAQLRHLNMTISTKVRKSFSCVHCATSKSKAKPADATGTVSNTILSPPTPTLLQQLDRSGTRTQQDRLHHHRSIKANLLLVSKTTIPVSYGLKTFHHLQMFQKQPRHSSAI